MTKRSEQSKRAWTTPRLMAIEPGSAETKGGKKADLQGSAKS